MMEVHFIPLDDAVIVYRPLRRLAFTGNHALAEYLRRRIDSSESKDDPAIEEFLQSVGFWEPDILPSEPTAFSQERYCPTTAALLMTNQCNMRCLYCYADAGTRLPEHLAWDTARVVIDKVRDNAAKSRAGRFAVAFHGGGEPSTCWDVLTKAVDYARSLDVPCHISMASNGVWTEQQAEYICHNFDGLSLSLDGTATIQNRQRPLACGGESFPILERSIRYLDQHDVDYGIRMTVMADSVQHLPEAVELICTSTKARVIQIEPTSTSARGVYADTPARMADDFCERFMEAYQIGKQVGRPVCYSAARPYEVTTMFCSATASSLVVVPGGTIVSCFEVYSSSLPGAEDFVIGRVEGNRVDVDFTALARFHEKQHARRSSCRNCLCYWHCCGDCSGRSMVGEVGQSIRCQVTRRITRDLLACYMAETDGMWLGSKEAYLSP